MGTGEYITLDMIEDLVAEILVHFPEYVSVVDTQISQADLTPVTQ
jgi:hypothetical protein